MDTMKRLDHERVKEKGEVTVENVMEARWLEAGPMVHDGVRCVGCSTSPIVGRRFECDQCFDYNLCQECYAATIAKKRILQTSVSIPSPSVSEEPHHFTRLSLETSPRKRRPSRFFPFNQNRSTEAQKQEHQPEHTFKDVFDEDEDWSRALRLRQGEVFRAVIGEKKLRALNWVMNKERSTQKTAFYLLDMKGEKEKDHIKKLTELNSVMNKESSAQKTAEKKNEKKDHFITDSDIKMKDLLIRALRNCWEDVALFLIKREVDIYVKDDKERTPLMWACKTNQPSVVEKLLERNTSGEEYIDKTNQEKMTALAIAVANKNDECIKHILHCGVPVEMYCHDKKELLPFSYKNIKDFLDGQINKIKPTWSVASGFLDNNSINFITVFSLKH